MVCRKRFVDCAVILVLWGLCAIVPSPGHASDGADLTFLHISDVHFPHAASQSRETIAALPKGGPIQLQPYGVQVQAPSFGVVTGDLNEFSGGGGWWEGYEKLWAGLNIPLYHQLGNHDNTWDCGRPRLRKLHGGAFYAFERAGIKFIAWDTATPQDPRPSTATEGLLWLQGQFAATAPDQPIMLLFHHSLDGREFASAYDRMRLLEMLKTRNVVLLLVGHGHAARAWQVDGIDTVMGGSTFGGNRGYSIVSIKDGVLRVCHQYVGDNPRVEGLLEKPLVLKAPAAVVAQVSPQDGSVLAPHEPLAWVVTAQSQVPLQSGKWTIDKDHSGDMVLEGAKWMARTKRGELAPGAHTVRFELVGEGVRTAKTVAFWLDEGPIRVAWKYQLSGSCQSTPTASGGKLFVGANDGCAYAFEADTGEPLWRFITRGEVRSQVIADPDGSTLYFASADGGLYALTPAGELKWRFDLGSPAYGSPLTSGDLVICGSSSGDISAVSKSGRLRWRSGAPGYAIETSLCAGGGRVFAGSWDRYVYALAQSTGVVGWRAPSKGSDRAGAAHYYSPADCAPAFAGGSLFVADRAYSLTVMDPATGGVGMTQGKCVAVSASEDGKFAYVRHTNGRVTKRKPDGSVVWTAEVPTGAIANPAVASGGRVWVVSNLGTLSVLDEETGAAVGQYKAFPGIYAYAAPAFDGERVYVADQAGNLLALYPPGA